MEAIDETSPAPTPAPISPVTVPAGLPDHGPASTSPSAAVEVRWGARTCDSAPVAPTSATRDPRTTLLRDHLAVLVGRIVSRSLTAIPRAERDRAYVVLAAHGYAALAVREFVAARRDESVRLRAAHSVALESSRLLTAVTEDDDAPEHDAPGTGWAGRAVVLTSPAGEEQALRTATAAVVAGTVPAAVAAQVRVEADDSGSEVCLVEAVPILRVPVAS